MKTMVFKGYCTNCGLMMTVDDSDKCPRCEHEGPPKPAKEVDERSIL